MLVGLTGLPSAGKDTVVQRARILFPERNVERRAFADKLKKSSANLFNISLEWMDELKVDGGAAIKVRTGHNEWRVYDMRTVLQRYGTEAHRDVFGPDFWLDECVTAGDFGWLQQRNKLIFITDVRFDNEAVRIRELGGQTWEVLGGGSRASSHASDARIKDALIDKVIENTVRDDDFRSLDLVLGTALNPYEHYYGAGRPLD